jgi:hypothetical protein
VREKETETTRRVGKTSCGEHVQTNPKAERGHVCRARFSSDFFDVLAFR